MRVRGARGALHVACVLALALVVVADADLEAEAAASGDPSPPRAPAPRTLEQELFACRVACQAELWDPVCVGGTMTYANACWARCASPLVRADAEAPPEPARPGRCPRERSPDENCVSGCVAAWGRDNAGAPAGPSLDGLGLEIVDHRSSQIALVRVVVVCVLLDPIADTYLGERATADVGLGATGRDALSERADELGRDARSERL